MEDRENHLCLCSPRNGYFVSLVQVQYSSEYNMKSHPLLHKNIEDVWQNKLKDGSYLYNASKFRLHRVDLVETKNSSLPALKLFVGLTCYKDFIGTNDAPYANELSQDGIRDFRNSQVYMSDPIGVGGLLISSDNDVIFMRRSKSCAEMPLLIDRPGGHPEPDAILSKTGQEIENIDASKITEEIFESVLKEIRDEINIPMKHLSSPILLGIGYNPQTWKRPSLEFYVKCVLKTQEIQELYLKQTQAESDESTELIVVPLKQIIDNDLIQIHDELTFPAKSAIAFLKVFLSKT